MLELLLTLIVILLVLWLLVCASVSSLIFYLAWLTYGLLRRSARRLGERDRKEANP